MVAVRLLVVADFTVIVVAHICVAPNWYLSELDCHATVYVACDSSSDRGHTRGVVEHYGFN